MGALCGAFNPSVSVACGVNFGSGGVAWNGRGVFFRPKGGDLPPLMHGINLDTHRLRVSLWLYFMRP